MAGKSAVGPAPRVRHPPPSAPNPLAPSPPRAGDTYPASLAVPAGQEAWLRAMGDPEGEASVVGLPVARRLLAGGAQQRTGEALKAVAEVQRAWDRVAEGRLVAGTGMAA